MYLNKILLVTVLICSSVQPALGQFNDPIVDGEIRSRQRDSQQTEGSSFYRRLQYNARKEEEQEILFRNVGIGIIVISLFIGGSAFASKNKTKTIEPPLQPPETKN